VMIFTISDIALQTRKSIVDVPRDAPMSFDMLNESLREDNLPLSLRSFERGERDK